MTFFTLKYLSYFKFCSIKTKNLLHNSQMQYYRTAFEFLFYLFLILFILISCILSFYSYLQIVVIVQDFFYHLVLPTKFASFFWSISPNSFHFYYQVMTYIIFLILVYTFNICIFSSFFFEKICIFSSHQHISSTIPQYLFLSLFLNFPTKCIRDKFGGIKGLFCY